MLMGDVNRGIGTQCVNQEAIRYPRTTITGDCDPP